MAFNPLVILVILGMMGTLFLAGSLGLLILLNINLVQILKDLGGGPRANNSLEKVEDYLQVDDISPAKTTIIRFPQYANYEIIVNRFVTASNGAVFLMQDDTIVWMLKNINQLVLDDGYSALRGDDYSIYRVEDESYKMYMSDKLKYNQQNLTRYKEMLEDSFKDNKELLKSTSEMVKEARKSLYSQNGPQQTWDPFRRRTTFSDLQSEQNEDG